uniref:Fibroblast growth factor n=1 Tax=Crocodylus porosus TaxID=8502 RepID=A0A7M4G0C4_CROPO
MHKWILTWILPILLYRLYFYIIFLMGTISLACNDMTPEQMATNVNCSSPERHTRSYDYMEGGDVRVRRLFCRTQWYMRIDERGKIKGTREANNNYNNFTAPISFQSLKGSSRCFIFFQTLGSVFHHLQVLRFMLLQGGDSGILEIRTVAVGIVAIKGVESEYFLAMNKSGKLYGKKVCNEDCNFIELIEENHYNTYASAKWTHKGNEMFITLNHKGIPIKGRTLEPT